MLNNASKERLNNFVLSLIGKLFDISEKAYAPNRILNKIHINRINIIALEDISLLLKNPPGYLAMKTAINIMNNNNPILKQAEIIEKLFNMLDDFESDNVKTIIKYKKANTERIIVINNE